MVSVKTFMSFALALSCVTSMGGCTTVVGRPILPEQVASISPGKTAKDDLLNKLGTPFAIVTREDLVRSDAFFTLFPEANSNDDIYYYHYGVSSRYDIPVFPYFGSFEKTKTDRLWVLVNSRKGIVENYAYKRYEADVVYGKSP